MDNVLPRSAFPIPELPFRVPQPKTYRRSMDLSLRKIGAGRLKASMGRAWTRSHALIREASLLDPVVTRSMLGWPGSGAHIGG
jgi:hypothetical protein